jgi:heme a synthase
MLAPLSHKARAGRMEEQLSAADVETVAVPRTDKAVVIWLSVIVTMIFVMVQLGGLTRLTHAGLSMVEWQPLTGWLPPATEVAWQNVFAGYRQFPEYQNLNVGMTLEEFKDIYMMEYAHRLWGRLIGIAFAVPVIFFAWRRRVTVVIGRLLTFAFILGTIQAGMGWYMVMSGLADEPDVSAYRLTAHLGLGTLILCILVWALLHAARPEPAAHGTSASMMVRVWSIVVGVLIFKTILAGGFVAGIDAGFTYNTFPLMDGRLIPEGLGDLSPFYLNFFENITAVQFNHRVLALSTVVAVLMLWLGIGRRPLAPAAQRAVGWLLTITLMQAGIGIATLLLVVPVPLAAAHQGGAMVLMGCALWTVYELRPGAPERGPIEAEVTATVAET